MPRPPMDREEYVRRWFKARDVLMGIALRITTIVMIGLISLNIYFVGMEALIGWVVGIAIAVMAASWALVFYAHEKGASAKRWSTIWDSYYHEPWRFVPRRESSGQ